MRRRRSSTGSGRAGSGTPGMVAQPGDRDRGRPGGYRRSVFCDRGQETVALVTKNVPEHNNRSQVMAVGVGPAQSNTGWFVQMQLSAFKRTLAMGAVWTVAMGGLLATSPAASGQEAVEPGLGNAYAQGVKIDPRTGQLSIGLTYGMSLAGHQNKVAIAEARSLDLGIIGTLLAGEGCDGGDPTLPAEQQPQPLVVRSGEDGADKGRS